MWSRAGEDGVGAAKWASGLAVLSRALVSHWQAMGWQQGEPSGVQHLEPSHSGQLHAVVLHTPPRTAVA